MVFIHILRFLFRWLPWVLALVAIYFLIEKVAPWFSPETDEPVEFATHSIVLQEIENLGKLELVRYNFKEITELKEKNKPYLYVFEVPDSEVLVVSHGEAVGCIDLAKIQGRDILEQGDTVFVRLPDPELCYYKLDMENTQIYSIDKKVYFKEESRLAQKALRLAERQMKKAALESGILEQTNENAETMLKPLLQKISGKTVIFLDQLPDNIPVEKAL